MLLSDLIGDSSFPAVRITHMTCDSRTVQTDDVFVVDSKEVGLDNARRFAQSAKDAGAQLVISDVATGGDITVDEPKAIFAKWAKATYPRQPKFVVGVTGTNGKTSVAWFFNKLLSACGYKAASIGTLGTYEGDNFKGYSGFTSPQADVLHEELQRLADAGITYACIEVSSHGLDLRRVEEVDFAAASFTNLTQDHLDYHETMESYALAKYRLFSELLADDKTAVLNLNRMESLPLAIQAKDRGLRILSVGSAQAELVVRVEDSLPDCLHLFIKYGDLQQHVTVPLIGAFQAENLAHAMGLALACGVQMDKLVQVLPQVTSAPGRMEVIAADHTATVVVDYAHTPDALQTALESVRPQLNAGASLWVVFGCGGDRDKTKRPLMGKIAYDLADEVVVADDNPRTENAKLIRDDIMDACPQAHNIGDREGAIRFALQKAAKDDIILLAGKGHESGQIIGKDVIPFDDREIARKIMAELNGLFE